ncbi:MAG: hypothetical protein HC810_00175 [Acaryochloridaceae cyanobacterium RL_2_7]|nr:hypothetical protein [Acaryochloridaceae cyanobacterium RL_2_7]
MLSLRPIPLTDLLLSRILFAEDKGLVTSELRQAMKAIAASDLSNSAYTDRIEAALAELSEQNYVQCASPEQQFPYPLSCPVNPWFAMLLF